MALRFRVSHQVFRYLFRYITNLQGLDDRAIRFKDEFHLDAELVIEQLTAEMKFMNETSALEKSIQDISLGQKMEIQGYHGFGCEKLVEKVLIQIDLAS